MVWLGCSDRQIVCGHRQAGAPAADTADKGSTSFCLRTCQAASKTSCSRPWQRAGSGMPPRGSAVDAAATCSCSRASSACTALQSAGARPTPSPPTSCRQPGRQTGSWLGRHGSILVEPTHWESTHHARRGGHRCGLQAGRQAGRQLTPASTLRHSSAICSTSSTGEPAPAAAASWSNLQGRQGTDQAKRAVQQVSELAG